MKKLLLLCLAMAGVFSARAELAFLAIGDWGRDGRDGQRENAEQMGRTAATIGSRFVLSLGDNFYERGVKSAGETQWDTSFENVYTAESLQTPWYVALGNHDYLTNPQAQVDRTKPGTRWRMPARYFTWTERVDGQTTAQFFCLDTTALIPSYRTTAGKFSDVGEQDAPAQLAWLERELTASRAQWKIVFGHHPIYSASKVHGDSADLIARLKPILERHGVQIYLAGHDHDLQHLRDGGPVNYFVSGAGSSTRDAGRDAQSLFSVGGISGFLSARLTAERMQVEFIDRDGHILYAKDIAQRVGVAPAAGS